LAGQQILKLIESSIVVVIGSSVELSVRRLAERLRRPAANA
jgi:hypothetical protein